MSEMEPWTRQILSVIVSQLCKTIGWHSISTTSLHVLVDVLHRYLRNMTSNVHDYAELFNHTMPTLEELSLALNDMGVNMDDLKEYVDYVAPIPLKIKVPLYPLEKKSNLNFLKPGSREVVTRPVHIHEHLPAMHPELSEENYANNETTHIENSTLPNLTDITSTSSTLRKPAENGETLVNKRIANVLSQEVSRPVRELSCVMMTSSGFLSPAVEGKLPEARLPKAVHNITIPESTASQPTTAPVTPESKSEQKKSSHSKSSSKSSERKNRTDENHSSSKDENIDEATKKSIHTKEILKVKVPKPIVDTPPPVEPVPDIPPIIRQEKLKIPLVVPPTPKETKISKQAKLEKKLEKLQRIQEQQQKIQEQQQQIQEQQQQMNEKLTTEPNKQKLNIFRRISKVKEDRVESPVSIPKSMDDRNAAINESIENVVKGFGEKDVIKHARDVREIREEENLPVCSKELVHPANPVPVEKKKRKKKKLRDGEPSAKKSKLSHEVVPVEVERPKPMMPEQPPPYPFFTQLPDSLETNYLIPRFTNLTNPFLNMTKLDPNCPHPEMPNLPLPPPMIPSTFLDNRQRSPVKWVPNEEKPLDLHAQTISDKKLKKKMKKDKREKDKKKRDKKDKVKSKEKQGAKKQDKLLKKVKNKEKMKKKNKLLNVVVPKEEIAEDPSVPKIKLRIGGTNSPLPSPSGVKSPMMNVSIVKHEDVPRNSEPSIRDLREPSPELAKMPALIGKPLKVKSQPKIVSEPILQTPKQVVEPITLSTKGKKPTVVSNTEIKLKNKEKPLKTKKVESSKSKPDPFYYDAEGNQVWVCPTCGGPDDGSPMIGCDGCDAWYHWVCVGIKSAPESLKWFCGICVRR